MSKIKIQNAVVIRNIINMIAFLDLSDRLEVLTLSRTNKPKPVNSKNPKPLSKTSWKFIFETHSPAVERNNLCRKVI